MAAHIDTGTMVTPNYRGSDRMYGPPRLCKDKVEA